MGHALLAPSAAHRWTRCPGSVRLTKDLPRTSSPAADRGTAAHEFAASCLALGGNPDTVRGMVTSVNGEEYTCDDAMLDLFMPYVEYVRDVEMTLEAPFDVEVKLPLTAFTKEKGAFGTTDAVILGSDELVIVDLKTGRGEMIDAPENEQLLLYALAASRFYALTHAFTKVRMVIVQPPLDHISEWSITVDELESLASDIQEHAGAVWNALASPSDYDLVPGDKQCHFCDARGSCPALERVVLDFVADEGTELPTDGESLAEKYRLVGLVRRWAKAVDEHVYAAMNSGTHVPGYKLVEGRRGNRKWGDLAEVEKLLKKARLAKAKTHQTVLISPAQMEALVKPGELPDAHWQKIREHIVQAPGAPAIAPESSNKPAINATVDDFDDVSLSGLV